MYSHGCPYVSFLLPAQVHLECCLNAADNSISVSIAVDPPAPLSVPGCGSSAGYPCWSWTIGVKLDGQPMAFSYFGPHLVRAIPWGKMTAFEFPLGKSILDILHWHDLGLLADGRAIVRVTVKQ